MGQRFIVMSEDEFHEHCDEYNGLCVKCMEVTRWGGTEPDAHGYPCPECGKRMCIGIQDALVMGYIEIH